MAERKPPRGRPRKVTDPAQRLEQNTEPDVFEVELPAGGKLEVRDANEVALWNSTKRRYIEDYRLSKINDLILLGSVLSYALTMYRTQREMGDPDHRKAEAAVVLHTKAAQEFRAAEKSLALDKASRDRGGEQSVAEYIRNLKRAGHERMVHISERTTEYERVLMEARWKIRLLRNGDTEDRAYHRLTDASIISWLEDELARLEQRSQEWAKEKGALFVGKM